MFKLAERKTVTWPVTVNIPQDGGRTVKATFDADFEVIDQDEMNAVNAENADLLDRVLAGWSGVADADGGPIAFSEEAKKKLLNVSYVRHALFVAFGELQIGRAAARKN